MHDAFSLWGAASDFFGPSSFKTMQIQYCDACGTRVEDTEAILYAGKYFCPQCAPKYVPAQKAGTVAMVGTPRGTTRAPRQAPANSSGLHGRIAASHDSERDRGIPIARDRAAQKPGSGDSLSSWLVNNTALAVTLGVGLLGLFIVVLWSLAKTDRPNPPTNSFKTTKDTTLQPTLKTATTNATTTVTTGGIPSTITTPLSTKSTDPDPRTDKAIRDLKAIKEIIAAGNANPFDVRKRLERLIEPFWVRKTPMGLEAAELLLKFKAEKRLPDKADGAAPGVTVAVSPPNEHIAEVFNTNFKPAEVKTVPDINIPNEGTLKGIFGRDQSIALKFTGFIIVPTDGEYTFYVSSDDGSMLYIGDTLLINNGGDHPNTELDGKLDFKAGTHAFRLEYFQGSGNAALVFSWAGPGINKQPIPASALSSIPKK